MIGIAILEIAVGVPSAYVALRSLKNASRGVYVGINFPATWYAEIVAYGTDFGDLESIAVAGIFPAAVAVWTLMLVRLQPASVSLSPKSCSLLSRADKVRSLSYTPPVSSLM